MSKSNLATIRSMMVDHFEPHTLSDIKTGVIHVFYQVIHNSPHAELFPETIDGCWDICQMLAFLEKLDKLEA